MPRYCTILPHAPLPCAAIMACRAIAPFYPTLLPCAAIMPCRAIAPFYPTLLPCAAIMPCRAIAPFYPTLLSLVLLLCHAEVLHHSTTRSSPLCCYYGMPRYCTILPHAPPLCCYYAMSSYCTILPHAPLPCAAIMACRGIAPFYPTLLPCAAIKPCRGIAPFYPTSSPLCCYYGMSSYCIILPHAPPLCCYYAMSSYCTILPHAPPLCCYYAMSSYCTILPHAPLPCTAIMPCRGIAPFYHTLLSLVLLLWHAEVLHHSTSRSSPLYCYYGMPMYCTILPHAPLPCAAIMPCRGIAPFYPTLLSLVLLLCHVEVLHHSTPRSSRVLLLWHAEVLHHSTSRSSPLCCYYAMSMNCTILPQAPLPCAASMPCRCIAPFYPTLLSLVLLLCHADVLHHSTSRSSPLCCYYAMSMNCTILPHAPLPCAASMPCRCIAPFYPTLLSLVLLLWHAEVLHHSNPRSPPLRCYYAMLRDCTILPHAPLPCAAIMQCRGIAPFYPTLLSLVLLLWHDEVLHHSTPRSSPLCCYYGMLRYSTILPHAPLPCAAIMPCRCIAPFYPTLLSLVLLLCHAEVLHHSTPRSSPLCCYYAMSRYCTILPHAPLPCAAIMPCRGIAPFYPTLLSLVLLLWHADVLHHSTPRSSPLCCYYAMSRYCTILPHAPLPCAAIMPCRGIAPFYPTLPSLVLLLCHAEVLHHSTPRSSLCCYYAMPRYSPFYPTLLSLVLLLCNAEVLHHSTTRSSPLCCYYAMPRYCTIQPHAPLPCAAIMPCRGIAPFYPCSTRVLLLWHAEVLHHSTPRSSRVLLLCHAELLHHSTPRSSPLCCYYGMPRYCTILPHAHLPCAAIMQCRGIAPFYPTLLSLVLLLWHDEVLHHSTPRSSPLCCYYGMLRYCTILPHAPLPCAAIMPCRGIAPFYPTLLSLVLLLCHAEVLHHSTPRSSPLCCYYAMSRYCTILPHAPLPCAAIMPFEVLHHSTPRSSPLCYYYGMPMYCTILPHAPLPCAAIMPCRGIAPFYPTLLSLVLLLCHVEVLHHSTPRSPPLCCYYAMPRYCTILPHAPPCAAIMPCRGIHHSTPRSSPVCCYYAMPRYCTILPHAPLPCAAIMPCRGIAPFYLTLLSLVLLLCHAEVLHHSTHAPPVCCYYGMPRYCTILPHAPPVCCYYAMPSYCTILPHAPLPCAVIMACRGIAPFYPTLISLVLLLWHADLLHHSTPRSSPLCCCYAMPRYCTILPHAPPLCCYYAMSSYCTILPHAPLPCAAIMACRGIAPFYPTRLPCAASMAC